MKRTDILMIIAKLKSVNKKTQKKINTISKRKTHLVKEVSNLTAWYKEDIAENEDLIRKSEKELEGME